MMIQVAEPVYKDSGKSRTLTGWNVFWRPVSIRGTWKGREIVRHRGDVI